MELKWEKTFSKIKLLTDNDDLICTYDYQDNHLIKLFDYKIGSNGFYNYYIRDSIDEAITLQIDTADISFTINDQIYNFIYENRQHCYIKLGQTIVASCYKDNGIFNSSGTIQINDDTSHRPIFAYVILFLRDIAMSIGVD